LGLTDFSTNGEELIKEEEIKQKNIPMKGFLKEVRIFMKEVHLHLVKIML